MALLVTGVPPRLWEDQNEESIVTAIGEWGVPQLQPNPDDVSDVTRIGPQSLRCVLKASPQSTPVKVQFTVLWIIIIIIY